MTTWSRPLILLVAIIFSLVSSTDTASARGFGGGSRSISRPIFHTRSGASINDRPAFHWGGFRSRSRNGNFYRVVNGKYTDAKVTGRLTNAVPTQYLRTATFNGRTYRWDSRTGFTQAIYSRDRSTYLGGINAPGPRLTHPYVPPTVYHMHLYPGYGFGGGYYQGTWYGPTLWDLFFWHYVFTGSFFGNGNYNAGYGNGYAAGANSGQMSTSSGSWGSVPTPQTSAPPATPETTPCDYYDANGHPVHVTVAGTSCPVTTDTSTPPPDAISATPPLDDSSSDSDDNQ